MCHLVLIWLKSHITEGRLLVILLRQFNCPIMLQSQTVCLAVLLWKQISQCYYFTPLHHQVNSSVNKWSLFVISLPRHCGIYLFQSTQRDSVTGRGQGSILSSSLSFYRHECKIQSQLQSHVRLYLDLEMILTRSLLFYLCIKDVLTLSGKFAIVTHSHEYQFINSSVRI